MVMVMIKCAEFIVGRGQQKKTMWLGVRVDAKNIRRSLLTQQCSGYSGKENARAHGDSNEDCSIKETRLIEGKQDSLSHLRCSSHYCHWSRPHTHLQTHLLQHKFISFKA